MSDSLVVFDIAHARSTLGGIGSFHWANELTLYATQGTPIASILIQDCRLLAVSVLRAFHITVAGLLKASSVLRRNSTRAPHG